MIFGKDYDRSLWIMMASEGNKRELIGEFIKNIPENLLKEIHQLINECPDGLIYERDYSLNGKYLGIDGYIYFYNIYVINKNLSLDICRSYDESKTFNERIELYLYPITEEQLVNMKNFDLEIVGYLCKSTTKTVYHDRFYYAMTPTYDSWYRLGKTPLGMVVLKNRQLLGKERMLGSRMKIIDLKKMPEEIYSSDLQNRDSVNRLVRTRKCEK